MNGTLRLRTELSPVDEIINGLVEAVDTVGSKLFRADDYTLSLMAKRPFYYY